MKAKTIIVATRYVMSRVAVDCSTFNFMFGSVVDDVRNLESIIIYPESEVERMVKERVDQIDAARKAVDVACKEYCEDDSITSENTAKIIEMENRTKELENRLKTMTTLANGEYEKYENAINDIRKASHILKEIIEKHDRYFTEG